MNETLSIVIFGGLGDLSQRKLLPAIYNLYLQQFLPKSFQILLIGKTKIEQTIVDKTIEEALNSYSRRGKIQQNDWNNFKKNIRYFEGNFTESPIYNTINIEIGKFSMHLQPHYRLFYLAISPIFFETVSDLIYQNKCCNLAQNDRLVIEKPFGSNLETAVKLNQFLLKRFKEDQIYRIDHYLGKETVQNILAFRFANTIFQPIWNHKYIDHIQISVVEDMNVGNRIGYYEKSGALRDMIQNHLLQLLCLIAMECPAGYNSKDIRNAKIKLLKQIRRFNTESVTKNIVRGQYIDGLHKGINQPSYQKEAIDYPNSTTETFFAGNFYIDNARWKNVPFFIRTGKCLPEKSSAILIQFKQPKTTIFKDDIFPNRLLINIQPEQEISLLFESKIPGVEMKLKPVEMDFTYNESYNEASPEAYEALLLDVIKGDSTLFMRNDQVEEAWKVVMPILDEWNKNPTKGLEKYAAGTWGPPSATKLLNPNAKNWILLNSLNKA